MTIEWALIKEEEPDLAPGREVRSYDNPGFSDDVWKLVEDALQTSDEGGGNFFTYQNGIRNDFWTIFVPDPQGGGGGLFVDYTTNAQGTVAGHEIFLRTAVICFFLGFYPPLLVQVLQWKIVGQAPECFNYIGLTSKKRKTSEAYSEVQFS